MHDFKMTFLGLLLHIAIYILCRYALFDNSIKKSIQGLDVVHYHLESWAVTHLE